MTDFLADAVDRILDGYDVGVGEACVYGYSGEVPEDQMGANALRRRDSVFSRAAGPRVSGVQGMPGEHRSSAERVPEEVLLRYGQLQYRRVEACDRFRGRGSSTSGLAIMRIRSGALG